MESLLNEKSSKKAFRANSLSNYSCKSTQKCIFALKVPKILSSTPISHSSTPKQWGKSSLISEENLVFYLYEKLVFSLIFTPKIKGII